MPRWLTVCWVGCFSLLATAVQAAEPQATPINLLKIKDGFQVELLYSVPKDKEGSWVSLCTDPKGRLIVCDQYGGLFRVTPPGINNSEETKIEKIDVPIGEAQGLLWAFDSLYVMVNRGKKYASGLYRVRDTDGDDQLDSVETLKILDGGAEHGPHAVLLSPDKKSLHVVCGNRTKQPKLSESRVPEVWDEDLLLPRIYGRGFMKGTPAQGGFICRIDPDGKNWELVANGFRNQYDAAFNKDGELFAYDADMEWDMNTPWYRPTRVCHVVSGAEFGWRNGAGKWPVYYPDSVPPTINIGPGSPTGVTFGYGAKFPEKYQEALFCCDWSYGKLYAVHLTPQGSSYTANLEEFITGTPLPLTDIVINPQDGAMYFTIGGRRVQSGLYRVTYKGGEKKQSTEELAANPKAAADARKLRKQLESFHLQEDPQAIALAWPNLSSKDRFLRYAARVAIEQQPLDQWREKALAETNPQASLEALLALVRQYRRPDAVRRDPELDTVPPTWTKQDAKMRAAFSGEAKATLKDVLKSLERLEWDSLSQRQKLHTLRVLEVAFSRLGPPTMKDRKQIISRFRPHFPAKTPALNLKLMELLVYLEADDLVEPSLNLLHAAPTQEEQIAIAKTLRELNSGWTTELATSYFKWFLEAATYKGGASFDLFVQSIKKDAIAALDPATKKKLKPLLEAKAEETPEIAAEPREFVRDWKITELLPKVEAGLTGRDFTQGRAMFAAGKCYSCHRFNNEGGAIGPDLTAVSGRFNPRDLLESIIEPSKTVSDQYQAMKFLMDDGKVIVGRIVNLSGDTFRVNTDMLNPNDLQGVDRNKIEIMEPATTSMMPKGLLNTLSEDEALDLIAYLLSRGNPDSPMFK
ncbi:c-type cytochrome [Thalassoroseus pseudoceratinae]|uniref:c-type cytochrome n=1 Tax=Thalassoroseus pseudoceratinae TaxID=2713176 RepID=UPI001422678A|nr:c-type cytochrome [Thalassoroseus pseudoceratinae]